MKKIFKILIVLVVLILVTIGIIIKINMENSKLILKCENIKNGHRVSYVKIYNNGNVKTSLNIGKNKKLSETEISKLIELINNVDKNKCDMIASQVKITSGKKVKIYNSKHEEITIKDFYLTNYTEEAKQIIEFLTINNWY